MISSIRKLLAEVVMFLFFLTVSPAVYAMSELESREMRRTAIVQMVVKRSRRRALDRHYGRVNYSEYNFEFIS